MKPAVTITAEQLRDLYVVRGLSIRACAKVLGLPTHGGLSSLLRRYEIAARPQINGFKRRVKGDRPPDTQGGWRGGKRTIPCDQCGKQLSRFPSLIHERNFCNRVHRSQWQDKTGQRFGHLLVTGIAGRNQHGQRLWTCKCDCGKAKSISGSALTNRVTSCGDSQHRTGEASHNWKGGTIEVVCANPGCNRTKRIYPSRKELYAMLYCSTKCSAVHRGSTTREKQNPRYIKRIAVVCAHCGRALRMLPARSQLYQKHFCNATCNGMWQSQHSRGKVNPNYRGGTPERRKVARRISASIRAAITEHKAGRTWESLVGYSLKELIKRLKSTMPPAFDWDKDFVKAKGGLHIDHIIPVTAFNFESPNDLDFKRCFALKNLRLLPARDNMRKGGKLDKPFQPALRLNDVSGLNDSPQLQ